VIYLTEGAELRLPQKNWPAMAGFGALTLFLILVGLGWIFRPAPLNGVAVDSRPEENGEVLSSDDL
jgi:hypothetical protein